MASRESLHFAFNIFVSFTILNETIDTFKVNFVHVQFVCPKILAMLYKFD